MENEFDYPLWSNFEDWEYVVQSGNFLVKYNEDGELRYFAIKSAVGHWAQVYRNDHPLFSLIEDFINTGDETIGKAIDLVITMNYTMSSIVPDEKFAREFYGSVKELLERLEEYKAEKSGRMTEEEILREDLEELELKDHSLE